MKFENYLIEDNKSLAYYTKKIQAECKPFLKEIKGARGTLTRHQNTPNPGGGGSIKKVSTVPAFKKTTRKDRQPLDSPLDFHILIDDWFANNKKFGWRARSSGLFCWGPQFPLLASDWMVFPAGKFQYVWSPKVTDLYGEVETIFDIAKGARIRAKEPEPAKGKSDKYLDDATNHAWEMFEENLAPSYSNKNLKKAVVSGKEIMVNCKYSYLVKQELIENVTELLGLNWQGAKFIGRRI